MISLSFIYHISGAVFSYLIADIQQYIGDMGSISKPRGLYVGREAYLIG